MYKFMNNYNFKESMLEKKLFETAQKYAEDSANEEK